MSADHGLSIAATAPRFGLWLGPLSALLLLIIPAPEAIPPEGWKTAAIALWMAVWWMTEAVAIPVTALLPLVLFPVMGVMSMADSAAPYANELIFLFMGGFFLAAGMESTGLHRRIALNVVGAVGTSPERLVLGFMLATALISMWISNTATTAMMLPIGLAVVGLFRVGAQGVPGSSGANDDDEHQDGGQLGVSLMLGLAYAASIGGVATLIGTPPNAVVAGAASELLGIEIGFAQWMIVGVPVSLIMLPIAWLLLVKVLHPPGRANADADELLARETAALGPMSPAEKRVAVIFVMAALGWMLRAPKTLGSVDLPGLQTWIPELRDSTIAMAAAFLLFLLPRGPAPRSAAGLTPPASVIPPSGATPASATASTSDSDAASAGFNPASHDRAHSARRLLEWDRARRIPWGVLILFGGGLSLARAMDRSGLSTWIGSGIAELASVPNFVIFVAVALLFVFLTEITSNAATATMGMPILAGAGVALGIPPLPLMITAGLAASMAFMLPVATPPNAIVFGSNYLTIPQMARAGFLLNLIAVALIAVVALILIPFAFPSP